MIGLYCSHNVPVKSYFECNAHSHAYHHEPGYYLKVKNKIKEFAHGRKIDVLDVGCGDGYFISELTDLKIDATFYGFDLSAQMLDSRGRSKRRKLEAEKINVFLFIADGFMLPLKNEVKFDIIHIDSVLHHMINKTRSKSLDLSKRLLEILVSRLNHDGILIIEEVNYESYFYPALASLVIFYGCKFLNLLRLDLSRIIPELKPGLEVNFLNLYSIERMLENFPGYAYLFQKDEPRIPLLYRFLVLRDISHIVYFFVKNDDAA